MHHAPSACAALLLFLSAPFALAQSAANQPAQPIAPPQPNRLSRSEVTSILADSRKIVSPNGVEQLISIPVNGTTQWLSIRGKDRRNPILLYLHGGPGSPTMPDDYTFQTPWEDFFTVVQWDQRGAGKTYASNDPKAVAPTMTIPQMTSDAEVVVRYLQKTYGKRRIFLLGHSWGSVLGVELAQRHPDWFYAYLGVGQMVNMQKNEAEGYQFALAQARATHNAEAEKDLLALAPYPGPPGSLTFDRIGAQRKWLMYYGGLTWGRKDFSYDGNARELSPDYTQKEVDSIDDGGLFSLTYLLQPLKAVDFDNITTFKCPIFLFEGRHDYAVSHTLAAAWFHRLKAPEKKLVWFNDSAHMVMQEQPGWFLYYLVTDLRPLAAKAGDIAPPSTEPVRN